MGLGAHWAASVTDLCGLVHDAHTCVAAAPDSDADCNAMVGLLGAPMSSSHVACLLALSGAAHGLKHSDFK